MIQLFNEDCLETMKRIPDGSIDLMLTDPPYNTTDCEWEYELNLSEMWLEWERILKPNGTWIFTATQPFTTDLIISRRGFFKYELVWVKNRGFGVMHAKNMPLKMHENIIVFSRGIIAHNGEKRMTYNPQMKEGKPYKKLVTKEQLAGTEHNLIRPSLKEKLIINDGERYADTILNFAKPQLCIHPTEKPLDLFRWLTLTYSNKGETVFDGYSGSGTTVIACIKEKRNFIGSELNKEYYDKAMQRIKIEQMQPALF